MSMELSSSMVIPYSANILADLSLWDNNFTATSIFSTNEFLNSDVCNITLKGCKRELDTGTNKTMMC